MTSSIAREEKAKLFNNSRWGVFMHFLAIPASTSKNPEELTSASWNRRVDAFRVDILARQLASVGAGYLFLTIGQNSGYYCAPNATLDKLTGRDPETSRCSKRDLISDLSDELKKYNIPLYVYLPSHAPMADFQATNMLGFIPEWDFSGWSPPNFTVYQRDGIVDKDSRLTKGQRNYESLIRDWAQRWGEKINGWWFDGCYYHETMYMSSDEPNFHSFAEAARSGNQNALVSFNCGVVYPPRIISSEEDFSAGECNIPEKMLETGFGDVPLWKRQVLTYLGTTWGQRPIRFDAKSTRKYTEDLNAQHAVVTWDVPFSHEDGTLHDDTLEILKALK